jgi:hypothetical protein
LRLPAIELPVISFVSEALKLHPEVPSILCASLAEIVAEKFVALTRRAGAELADAGGPRDAALVRHVYDLHMIRGHYDIAEVVALVRTIILADVKAYGHQFPAYRDDPMGETVRAVAGLKADPAFAKRYAEFMRDMVYSEGPEFEEALSTTAALAARLGA